jgi:hypothetical protein
MALLHDRCLLSPRREKAKPLKSFFIDCKTRRYITEYIGGVGVRSFPSRAWRIVLGHGDHRSKAS